jgi:hypothetical protein
MALGAYAAKHIGLNPGQCCIRVAAGATSASAISPVVASAAIRYQIAVLIETLTASRPTTTENSNGSQAEKKPGEWNVKRLWRLCHKIDSRVGSV